VLSSVSQRNLFHRGSGRNAGDSSENVGDALLRESCIMVTTMMQDSL
jgi:hypothetical protein